MIVLHRFGNFLLIIGVIFLLYFFASDQSENPQFLLFFSGVALTALGILLMRRRPPAPEGGGRFRLLHKIFKRSAKPKK